MATRPRVLLLTPDFPPDPGGIQALMHGLATHLRGIDLRVVTITSADARSFDARQAVTVRRAPRVPLGQAASVLGLNTLAAAEAARFRPHVVLSGHIVTSPAAAAIRRWLGAPFVQYTLAAELGLRPGLATFAVRRADAVVAISRHTEQLALRAGAAPDRVHRIAPNIELPPQPPGERTGPPTILTVAGLDYRYKGHDVMLRALPLVRAKVPDASWKVVGAGALRPRLEEMAHDLGVADAVDFLGAVSDEERDALLAQAHVFAMPSRLPPDGIGGEGFGIVYLEAAARGLPVVAGGVGGALDAVEDGRTGLLVDPTDHLAVAEALTGLLTDPVRAEALGHAGRERVASFAWPAAAKRVEELIADLAGAPA